MFYYIGDTRTPCTQRFVNQQYLEICVSNPWTDKLSRLIRTIGLIFVYSYVSNIHRLSPSHVSKSGRVIYLRLSPFAVKPMFWFSLLANEITGNFISSSGCGPNCSLYLSPLDRIVQEKFL